MPRPRLGDLTIDEERLDEAQMQLHANRGDRVLRMSSDDLAQLVERVVDEVRSETRHVPYYGVQPLADARQQALPTQEESRQEQLRREEMSRLEQQNSELARRLDELTIRLDEASRRGGSSSETIVITDRGSSTASPVVSPAYRLHHRREVAGRQTTTVPLSGTASPSIPVPASVTSRPGTSGCAVTCRSAIQRSTLCRSSMRRWAARAALASQATWCGTWRASPHASHPTWGWVSASSTVRRHTQAPTSSWAAPSTWAVAPSLRTTLFAASSNRTSWHWVTDLYFKG